MMDLGRRVWRRVANRTPNVSGGDLLSALGPIGPPLSLAPGDGNVKSESVKGSNPSESQKKGIGFRCETNGNSAPTVSDSDC